MNIIDLYMNHINLWTNKNKLFPKFLDTVRTILRSLHAIIWWKIEQNSNGKYTKFWTHKRLNIACLSGPDGCKCKDSTPPIWHVTGYSNYPNFSLICILVCQLHHIPQVRFMHIKASTHATISLQHRLDLIQTQDSIHSYTLTYHTMNKGGLEITYCIFHRISKLILIVCFVVIIYCLFLWIHMIQLLMSFMVASVALGQSWFPQFHWNNPEGYG